MIPLQPTTARFSGALANSVRASVLTLEQNSQLNLFVTDVCGMTGPRTAIELQKRGVIPAQETFFREITAIIVMTYFTGWLGTLALQAFRTNTMNPLNMDHKAWVDAKTLGSYRQVLKDVLASSKPASAEALQKTFLQTVFQRLQSTDSIAQMPSQELKKLGIFDFSSYFPDQGRLSKAHVDKLVHKFMHGYSEKGNILSNRPFNIEEQVITRMKDSVYQYEVGHAVLQAKQKFLEGRKLNNLSGNEKALLSVIEADARKKALNTQKLALRRLIRQEILSQEEPFLKELYNFATTEGKITEHMALLDSQGDRVMAQSLKNWLSKTKYFMEEFLNRALADPITGAISNKTLPMDRIERYLLPKNKGFWAFNLPRVSDDLITYSYRSKFFISVIPMVISTLVGISMVYINNWLSKRRLGKTLFPGEEALLQQEQQRLAKASMS